MTRALPELHAATVVRTWTESHALTGVELRADAVARAHTHPGQYVVVTVDGEAPGHFAIASAPGHGVELLVKRGGSTADRLAEARAGLNVRVSAPAGPGFPVEKHEQRDLVLVASGAGIAPLHAVLQHVTAHRRRFGRVSLYYGQRHAHDFAYEAELPRWDAADVRVVRVLSGNDRAWSGARGRVQDALGADKPKLHGAIAYVCGMRDMIAATRHVLTDLGVAATDVLTNY